jgi:hypothetical protein
MRRFSILILIITILSGASVAMAADGDIRTCALTKGIECAADEGCSEWTIQEMGLPRFVRIDLNAKTITSLDREVTRNSKIASVERPEGLVVLHGTEQRGWSMALGEDSGALTLTASGDNEGFIVFGSCMNP